MFNIIMKNIYSKITLLSAIALLFLIGLQACTSSTGPQAIQYGKDQCVYCKMTISDARYGTQLVTKKGRAYNFDDVQCMIAYVEDGDISRDDIAAFYLPDFKSNELLPAEELFYLKSEALKSPMRGDIAAFKSKSDMEETLAEVGGTPLTWDNLWE